MLKPHLSALAVENHGMTAVGGGTFLAYLFVYYLQILKFDDEISFPLQIHNLRYIFFFFFNWCIFAEANVTFCIVNY